MTNVEKAGKLGSAFHALTPDQMKEYLANPMAADDKVRRWAAIPVDSYYSASVWPEEGAGRIWITERLHRSTPANKISKSDQ